MQKKRQNESRKVFLIGLDGATFDIIIPLVEKGEMKNIASLMREGVWSKLRSTIPAFSPIAWTSLMTGVNPGKHGIVDVYNHHTDYRLSLVNSTYRRYKPMWSVLNEFDKKTGIMNVPLTYPPEKVDGFMITGMLTPENVDDFVYPKQLYRSLVGRFGEYEFEAAQSDNLERVINATYEILDQRDKIASYLLSEYELEFFFLVFAETDRIQHQFWKFMDRENSNVKQQDRRRYENIIVDVYQRLDVSIGKILKQIKDGDAVIIVSDHGFGPLYRAFSLSNWLIERGYTVYKKEKAHIPFTSLYLDKIKRKIFGKCGDKDEELSRFLCKIDWKRTAAVTEGAAGGIFINMQGRQREGIVREGADYEKLRSEVIGALKELRDPLTWSKVVEEVYRREDIYTGDNLDSIPDLIVTCSHGYYPISPSECALHRLDNRDMFFTHKWSGKHEDNGILIMKGPLIKQGYNLRNANIMDVAPTILYLMNVPISEEFDGKVLLDALKDTYITTHSVRYTDSYTLKVGRRGEKVFSDEESQQIKEILKSLGYIDLN